MMMMMMMMMMMQQDSETVFIFSEDTLSFVLPFSFSVRLHLH